MEIDTLESSIQSLDVPPKFEKMTVVTVEYSRGIERVVVNREIKIWRIIESLKKSVTKGLVFLKKKTL